MLILSIARLFISLHISTRNAGSVLLAFGALARNTWARRRTLSLDFGLLGTLFALVSLAGSVLVFHTELLLATRPQLAAHAPVADGNVMGRLLQEQAPRGLTVLDLPADALAQQEDGKFLVAGDFTSFAGQPRGRIARLSATGGVDVAFAPGNGLNGAVLAMLLQPGDGKIVVAGRFTAVDNEVRPYIARLNNDKSFIQNRSVTFTPPVRSQGEFRLTVNTQAGFTYTLESSDTVRGAWTRGQSIVADGPTVTFTASSADSRRFFRVRRE